MSRDFNDLLHLYACAIYNKPIDEGTYNIENILKFAKKHEILQTVFLSVKKLYKDGKTNLTSEQFNALNLQFVSSIALNVRKTQGAYEAIEELENNGVKCCLLKGDSVARFYASPETRISSDIDVLINEEDEIKSIEILKNLDFTVKEKGVNDHHYKAISPDNAILEVHTMLYSKSTEKIIFGGHINYSKDYTKIELANDVTVNTLNTFDNALYLTAHLLKHFVNSGVGLRQVSDLLIFVNNFKDEIDFERYFETLEKVKFLKLILTVFKIGNKYFGTDLPLKYDVDDLLVEKLLDDMENGGVFGNKNVRTTAFYSQFASLRMNDENKKYKMRSTKKLFPRLSEMQKMYPFLKECPFLLPVAHLMRFYRIFARIFFKKKDKNELNEKTFSLFKDFDII